MEYTYSFGHQLLDNFLEIALQRQLAQTLISRVRTVTRQRELARPIVSLLTLEESLEAIFAVF